jgi:hypothetical protein
MDDEDEYFIGGINDRVKLVYYPVIKTGHLQ